MSGDDIGQEEAWRDLVARIAEPAGDDDDPPPWPARESLAGGLRPAPGDPLMGPLTSPQLDPPAATGEEAAEGAEGPGDPEGAEDPQGAVGAEGGGAAADAGGAGTAEPGPGAAQPGKPAPPGRARVIRPASPAAPAAPAAPARADDEDHYVPPPPPPLPRLDPVAKGAWLGLFGGPGYLLVSVMAGWTVPGWAAFCGVGAFVAGFATLVMRIGDRPPGDSGPDDGAVV
ncbi:MAG: hypothetical protein LBI49_07105 [Nocardiopsaceae bacterium]|jgi:hypothetical protein|nr:hypothetical protein [Nocardiopsaceae bacterium]